MLAMRLRLSELMAAHKPPLTTAYQLAIATDHRVSMTNAYRLVKSEGRPTRVELETLEILCHTFRVGPEKLLKLDEPLERKVG